MLLSAKCNMINSEIVKEVLQKQLPITSLNSVVPSDLQSGFHQIAAALLALSLGVSLTQNVICVKL